MNNENMALVLFLVDDRYFALESNCVYEIVNTQPVTKLPFVEDYIDGLVSVDGLIATQIDLSRYITGEGSDNECKELIILKIENNLFALKINKVLIKYDISIDELHTIDNEEGASSDEKGLIVKGEFEWNSHTVFLLNTDRIRNLLDVQGAPKTKKGLLGRVGTNDDDDNITEHAYLVVENNKEKFTFLLEQVVEIIPAQEITSVPGSPDCVLGITVIRGEPLLMLSTDKLLDEEIIEHGDNSDFLIMNISGKRLGLVFDKVIGIDKYPEDALHQTNIASNKASGVLIDRDNNLLTLLDPELLVDSDCIKLINKYIPEHREQKNEDSQEFVQSLLMTMNDENYAIPVSSIKRIMAWKKPAKLDDDYLRDSKLPIVGVTEWDGTVIPVINILGAQSKKRENHDYRGFVIIGNDKENMAISVDEAKQLIEIPYNRIKSYSDSDNNLLSGVANIDSLLVSIVNVSPLLENIDEARI